MGLVCFVGPLAYFPFVLRIYRLKLVFSAQEKYFDQKKKPIDLIQQCKESRIIRILMVCLMCATVIYSIVAISCYFVHDGAVKNAYLFLMPTFDQTSFFVRNAEAFE